jgi:hypothetical protein
MNRAHPGSNSLDYDLDARQCAFDFTLHPLNLGLEECLRLPKFGRESPSIEFEVKRTTEDMILSASTSIWVSGFESFSPLNCRSLPPHPTKAIFQPELPKIRAESS